MPPAVASPAALADFHADLARIETLAARLIETEDELWDTLFDIYVSVARASFANYDVKDIAKAAPEVIYRLFDVRMRLRERRDEWAPLGILSHNNVVKLRDCLRILRYASDMLGEMANGFPRTKEGDPSRRAFTGGGHSTLVNWPFYNGKDIAFRKGDVVLVRGHAHNSAAIARIGDVNSQFSHIAILHIDGEGAHWIVESLIEDGAIVNSLDHSLSHGLVRAALYRHRDEALAARAAEMIHEYVAASRGTLARRILYDFSMRLDKRRRLFCAKLVRHAFDKASEGQLLLPTYPTRLGGKDSEFLGLLGIKAEHTFAPADIDLEPNFDLIVEWQDYRETGNVRLQDFVMDKLFEWMDDPRHKFRFKETWLVWIVSIFGRLSSRLSDKAKDLISSVVPKVPINMRRGTLATVIMLHKTAEPLYHELQMLNDRSIAAAGRPLIGEEIYAALEQIREREGARIGYLERTAKAAG